jgi:hypothetical protein
MPNYVRVVLFTVLLAITPALASAGNLFVTGHDSDEHANGPYMSAGLDFLLFGTASTPAARAGKTIAVLDDSGGGSAVSALNSLGWSATLYDTDANFSAAFSANAIMTASGPSSNLRSALLSATTDLTNYFNAGGSLYINTDQGGGQSWYDFVPNFGTTLNNTISISGAFTPTAAGLGIGLTNAIVDADITHSFYTGVNTSLFTVFENTDPQFFTSPGHPLPVAFGARNIGITGQGPGGGFTGGQVPEPSTILLLASGLAGLAAWRARKA